MNGAQTNRGKTPVSAGLSLERARQRRREILDDYRKAFAGFSADEQAILDGVILDDVAASDR